MSVLNFPEYIAANLEFLSPPVCNRMVHNEGTLRIMIVGGPNQRKDYHLNLGEEIFYQIKGDMCLNVMECGEPKDVWIREGEFFVLPGKIAHSPQRFEGTVGLVIERKRADDELDGLRYYVDDTNQDVLWQRFFHVTNLGAQLVPLIKEFFASDAFTSRTPVADVDVQTPEGSWEPDAQQLLSSPFLLAGRFPELIATPGRPPIRLGNREFVVDLVGDATQTPALPLETEVWLYLLSGSASGVGKLTSGSGGAAESNDEDSEFVLSRPGDTLLLRGGLTSLVCHSAEAASTEGSDVAPSGLQDPTRLLVIYSTAF
ncbi:3-hydroxyanthranilate-dioxygenase, putative [Bodo saltans]|uniref:3-hydroxyanthranilate 3,4-dioxygenase n=1 Tax=Bodo saltans TaxID=75058 RepID=A0A0S4JA53_BODSA|nr:3-hydroxyanthranilate-dioxygenase, putative [Bodo saltans]|eukprot:CUG88342.1 3-hydroxyanthranilate-dioxygenase, putative [Bodo saltans]